MTGETGQGNRVLVVDDDAGLARALAINLRAHGWDVTVAATGAGGLDAASSAHPDVIVLDLGLPDVPGLEVLQGIRGWSRVPIVVLSARELNEDKVDALDAGADDYVTKPFAMNELLARLRAAVRRAAPAAPAAAVVEAGRLRIDLARRTVERDGADVRLTPTEWSLLEVLVRQRGRMVGRLQLLQEVWGPGYDTETNYLRVYTAQLRRKLEDDPGRPRHLITHPGAGYRFEV
ncbi:two-component system KDP operon response regulator KdpE [Isoptericola sp. CG 20/1183]|uniref:Two-component system KDP operon response regulator KdpE n=1 Tax=Isoptericola halotolerans TaxID=300560 RepID=A0ABX5ELB5_9MICO|nr:MULTISPECIES: response regulator transcription factor [Isoptericola]PRZ02937.1 two-component system KDP operon response regulator KdpE [Isoptericola sp. CG 20/1183]PRZ09934.1 two-component system KDP operon response regulator KdpE [Isoptericola halotolerans]